MSPAVTEARQLGLAAARVVLDLYLGDREMLLGGAIIVGGFVTGLIIVIKWIDHGFGALGLNKLAVVAFTLLVVGLQIFFSSFLLSILGLRRREGS